MTLHEHLTPAELHACNERALFGAIARSARRLLQARTRLMTGMLAPGPHLDAFEQAVQDAVKTLELDIAEAVKFGLFEE